MASVPLKTVEEILICLFVPIFLSMNAPVADTLTRSDEPPLISRLVNIGLVTFNEAVVVPS